MTDTTTEDAQLAPPAWTLPVRLGVGLIQGAAFYALTETDSLVWAEQHRSLHGAALIVTAFVPLILLAGLGHLRRATLAIWALVATAILAGLALYSGGNMVANQNGHSNDAPGFALMLAGAVAVFIAHHLIAGADAERRLVASYRTYFDIAWKHAVQLGLSLLFVAVFWMLLWLGAALFRLIGIHAFQDVLKEDWFHDPVLTLAFAAAAHLTDARASLTKGARTLGLTLLSWLTPIMAVIVAGFLIALPFTGLKPLWDTKSAASVLLSASAVLIVLINAAYQDGAREHGAHVVLHWAVRLAALALTPLTLIAGYAVWLRVGQYGLTPERVMAATLALLSACYAIGYGVAAVLPGAWMKPLERTNIVNACVALLLFLAIFTPVADPARLSVDDQVARLNRGAIAAAKFDFDFLRFDSGRYGMDALKRLAHSHDAAVAKAAQAALARQWALPKDNALPAGAKAQITLYPAGAHLPADFDTQPDVVRQCRSGCAGYLADLDGDGAAEMVVGQPFMANVYSRAPAGGWTQVGTLDGLDCPAAAAALKQGRFTLQPSRWRDIDAGGVRLSVSPNDGRCPAASPAPATPPSSATR